MITKQVCYCEYCGANFTGEKSEEECAKHELLHLTNVDISEVEMFCTPRAVISSVGIAPLALLVPFEGNSSTLKRRKYYAVYELSNFYPATADPEGAGKNARKYAQKLAGNDISFKPEYRNDSKKREADVSGT